MFSVRPCVLCVKLGLHPKEGGECKPRPAPSVAWCGILPGVLDWGRGPVAPSGLRFGSVGDLTLSGLRLLPSMRLGTPGGAPSPCRVPSPDPTTPPRHCRVFGEPWGTLRAAAGAKAELNLKSALPPLGTHMGRSWVPCWPVWSVVLSGLVLLYLSPCSCAWRHPGPGSPSTTPDWQGGWVRSVPACGLAGWPPAVHLCPER